VQQGSESNTVDLGQDKSPDSDETSAAASEGKETTAVALERGRSPEGDDSATAIRERGRVPDGLKI